MDLAQLVRYQVIRSTVVMHLNYLRFRVTHTPSPVVDGNVIFSLSDGTTLSIPGTLSNDDILPYIRLTYPEIYL
jgi:hypothetical protein